MDENIKSICDYFAPHTIFTIPNYQRGYKWGIPNADNSCAISILISNLLDAYNNDVQEYFIQGVTVYEDENRVYLIDGQQRTTTFYLLMKYLDIDLIDSIELDYNVRSESDQFLKRIKKVKSKDELLLICKKDTKEPFQDIYYFKKAIRTINNILTAPIYKEGKSLTGFKSYILRETKLFYITIALEQAPNTFRMLNGNKAFMRVEELIKSSLLIKASRDENNNITNTNQDNRIFTTDHDINDQNTLTTEEWEINALRSKYAREWDKWLYWWNRQDVSDFYNSSKNSMGLLLEFFYLRNSKTIEKKYSNKPKDVATTYKLFSQEFLNNKKQAKIVFKEIRDLQKKFEDWFNDYYIYNHIGLIFKSGLPRRDSLLFLLGLDKKCFQKELEELSKWSLVDVSIKELIENTDDKEGAKVAKAITVINKLSQKEVYNVNNELALKQLLRRNVQLDNKLERKFDFNIYGDRSLEHIFPKSWEDHEESKLNFKDDLINKLSVHSLGNLVLLDKKTNSIFRAAVFEEKKSRYFNIENTSWSLKLLHSISVFSKSKWDEESIFNNQVEFIDELKSEYGIK